MTGNEFVRSRLDRSKEVVVRPSVGHEISRKPVGFWYSVNLGWESWCASDMPGWLKDRYFHKVTLGAEKILYLRSVEEIDQFHKEFQATPPGYRSSLFRHELIDWPKVATRYDGIEIAPYQWDRRFDGSASEWYYTWDCASGVIWNPRGVVTTFVGEYKPENLCPDCGKGNHD